MKPTASKRFWQCFDALPAEVQALARRNYALLRTDPSHPSLQFKTVGGARFHSVRVGLYYRALGIPVQEGVHWFWIGTHAEYDKLVGQLFCNRRPNRFAHGLRLGFNVGRRHNQHAVEPTGGDDHAECDC